MTNDSIALWKERSQAIDAVVHEVSSVKEALRCLIDIVVAAAPHEQLMGPEPAGKKMLAAPGFPEDQAAFLRDTCAEQGLEFIESGLREHTGGLEVGAAWATAGLADTGSCVVVSTDENVRLATMLPETGVLLVRSSTVLPAMTESAELLRRLFGGESTFVAFISGPSRTADIERVLTLGVHGPLFQHVILIIDSDESAQESR